jgi:hypothetical protein
MFQNIHSGFKHIAQGAKRTYDAVTGVKDAAKSFSSPRPPRMPKAKPFSETREAIHDIGSGIKKTAGWAGSAAKGVGKATSYAIKKAPRVINRVNKFIVRHPKTMVGLGLAAGAYALTRPSKDEGDGQ